MVDVYTGTVAHRASLSREPLNDEVIDQIVNLLLHSCIPTQPPHGATDFRRFPVAGGDAVGGEGGEVVVAGAVDVG
uniref:hypothetical protein n=1 Tax=Actinacidiphila soli TaxID=2487275 RepID=UPI0013E3FD47